MLLLRRRYFTFLISLFLLGCGDTKPKFNATDITGAPFAKSLALTDHNGKARTLEDFKGKVVLISFGFTSCPDYCPATLAQWAAVMKVLGDDAKNVQALFVTVDPERDTQELLSKYVPAFHPSFLGLRGTLEETKKVAAEFKVVFQKAKGASPETYTVDHSTMTFVFDQKGQVRLMVSHGVPLPNLVADLTTLLRLIGK
jgi:protein SCO1